MRAAGFLVALALTAGSAVAQEPQKEGRVWRGTLGETAITVCFFEQDARAGIYYADAALEPIRLEPTDDSAPQVARELRGFDEATGAVWTFAPEAGDRLAGDWQDAGRTRPIRLNAMPAAFSEYGTPCESEAFLAPLLAGGETTVTLRGKGRGGRNSEFLLALALAALQAGRSPLIYSAAGPDDPAVTS